jgi:hypothetical protein
MGAPANRVGRLQVVMGMLPPPPPPPPPQGRRSILVAEDRRTGHFALGEVQRVDALVPEVRSLDSEIGVRGTPYIDERCTIRQSHNNPLIQMVYTEFLGEPNGERSHELLHTSYRDRSRKVQHTMKMIWDEIAAGR